MISFRAASGTPRGRPGGRPYGLMLAGNLDGVQDGGVGLVDKLEELESVSDEVLEVRHG